MKRTIQRIRGKSFRDYMIYLRRKLFLARVKRAYKKYGDDHFFSEKYLGAYATNRVAGLESYTGVFFGITRKLDERLGEWAERHAAEAKALIDAAERYSRHEFDLLGSGSVILDFPVTPVGIRGVKYDLNAPTVPKNSFHTQPGYSAIDWHCDFKSGYRWDPREYYDLARNYTKFVGADIKVPWELSRAQHLPQLGLAFRLTKEERYAREVVSQISDWIANNPLCKGPNWACTMDVAIRAANWLVAIELIGDWTFGSKSGFERQFHASLIQHQDYIINNLEWTSRLTSNHYLSDIAGLLFCSIYIKGLKKRRSLIKFLVAEFDAEIKKQMYPDGTNSEGSLYYHRLVLELFFYSAALAKVNGVVLPSNFEVSLEQSIVASAYLVSPDGSFPQIGDNDSGFFFKFFPREVKDCSYVPNLNLQVAGQPSENRPNDSTSIEGVLVGGSKAARSDPGEDYVMHYGNAGLVVVKRGGLFLTFYNGPNGQKGNGGHCHNDRNSVTVHWRGSPLFLDPGTGVYTAIPEVRNQFRSTMSYNTVSVGQEEQNRFPSNGYLFGSCEDVQQRHLLVEQDDDNTSIFGSHDGYCRISDNLVHNRQLRISGNACLEIVDWFVDDTREKFAYFNISGEHELSVGKDCVRSTQLDMRFEGAIGLVLEEADYSPEYGVIAERAITKLIVKFNRKLKTTVKLK